MSTIDPFFRGPADCLLTSPAGKVQRYSVLQHFQNTSKRASTAVEISQSPLASMGCVLTSGLSSPIFLPDKKCAGVSSCAASAVSPTKVNGLESRHVSISHGRFSSCSRLRLLVPMVFFRQDLVERMSCSDQPSHHGALGAMNFQCREWRPQLLLKTLCQANRHLGIV